MYIYYTYTHTSACSCLSVHLATSSFPLLSVHLFHPRYYPISRFVRLPLVSHETGKACLRSSLLSNLERDDETPRTYIYAPKVNRFSCLHRIPGECVFLRDSSSSFSSPRSSSPACAAVPVFHIVEGREHDGRCGTPCGREK